MSKFKILSLDGGGTWALLQAMALERLFNDAPGHEILGKFDLCIANSGGSMVLAQLIEGKRPSQIKQMFLSDATRSSLFSPLGFFERKGLVSMLEPLLGFGVKYSAKRKLDGLRKNLPVSGGWYMSEIPNLIGNPNIQFIICNFDYDRNREVFQRSNTTSLADTHHYENMHYPSPMPSMFYDVTLAEAVHGASNAPLNYFDEPAKYPYKTQRFERQFWDGAIGGFNNPVLAGVMEALVNGKNANELYTLSIGTGNNSLPIDIDPSNPIQTTNQAFVQKKAKTTFKEDILKMVKSILSDPPDAASYTSYALVEPGTPTVSPRFIRLNPLIQPILSGNVYTQPAGLTDKEFEKLIKLDMDLTKQEDVDLVEKFGRLWLADAVPNQPIRMNSKMQCLIGHDLFSKGKQHLDTWWA